VSVIEPGNYISGASNTSEKSFGQYADSMWKEIDQDVREAYGEKYFKVRRGNLNKAQ
jgi:hypothetical protein